jgi:SLT domain-containing protein
MGMVQEKHNKVVRCITKAIAQGDKGAHHIAYTDGGKLQKWVANKAGELHKTMSHLPPDLLTIEELRQCKSKPDILMYRKQSRARAHPTAEQTQPRPTEINIIEFKFVRDTTPTQNATNPHQQHAA